MSRKIKKIKIKKKIPYTISEEITESYCNLRRRTERKGRSVKPYTHKKNAIKTKNRMQNRQK